jgi:hypothetical protein
MEFAEPLRSAGLDSRERTLSAHVVNLGDSPARNVRFLDAPLGAFRLIPGTVTSDRGRVMRGNNGSDRIVEIALGDLRGGDSVRLVYVVEIEWSVLGFAGNGKPVQLFRNGWIRSDGLADIQGDDPTTRTRFDGTPTIFVGFP